MDEHSEKLSAWCWGYDLVIKVPAAFVPHMKNRVQVFQTHVHNGRVLWPSYNTSV